MDDAAVDQSQEQMSANAALAAQQFGQFGDQIQRFQQGGGQADEDSGLPGLNILFFGAGCTLMFGSSIGMMAMFFTLSFSDLLGLIYVFLMGGALAALDAPVRHDTQPTLVMADQTIAKYFTFLTSTTGKGVSIVITACFLACLMFSNFDSVFIKFLEFCMMSATVFIGLLGASIGWRKTHVLNNVREAVLVCCPGGVHQVESAMGPYALTFPPENGVGHSLTMDEFNKFIMEVASCEEYSYDDLKLIFKGLRQRRPGMNKTIPAIDMNDVEGWLEGRRVYV